MKFVWIHSIFLLLLMKPTIQAVFTCDPVTDCQMATTPGDMVPDPDDCERYYICIDSGANLIPTASSIPCEIGKFFDHVTSSCVIETEPGVCVNLCIPSCISECPIPFMSTIFVANKRDCTHFFVCTNVGAVDTTCPSDKPYFNGKECVSDSSQCCNFCTPKCPAPLTEIEDPCDCTSYYICDENSVLVLHGNCDPGTYFDESTFKCIAGTCTSICLNCGSILTTTTIAQGCSSTFTCPSDGDYVRCSVCDKSYWHCSGGVENIFYCTGSQVFNTDPEYPYCILPGNCPYHPSPFIF